LAISVSQFTEQKSMFKKVALGLLTAVLLLALTTIGFTATPVHAQDDATPVATEGGDGDTETRIEVTGTVTSITPKNDQVSIVILDDGSEILVNPDTDGAENFVVGQVVTIIVSVEDDGEELTAKSATAGAPAEEPTDEATDVATDVPTDVATDVATDVPTDVATEVGTAVATCGGPNAHPVATQLADAFGVSYDEIMGLHCQGMGFGNIAKAYGLAKLSGKSVDEFLAMREQGMGWGQIIKGEGVNPSDLAPGKLKKQKSGDDDSAGTTSDSGKGKGNKGKGNGKDKGKGKNGG
jgi:hypothetical protein